MILRDEVGERLIITQQTGKCWWETDVYDINDDGLLWLSRWDSYTEDKARERHEKAVAKEQPKVIHICKYCSEIALTYWSLSKAWMCDHHFNIYVRECS